MKKIVFIVFFVLNCFGIEIKIAAAANVSYALEDIITAYKQVDPTVSIKTTISSSGKLTAMLLHGAKYDIFLSANMLYPKRLYQKKIALSPPKVYAQGLVVLFSRKKRDLSSLSLLLKSEDIKKIAIANPKTAPYGKASFEFLKNTHLLDSLRQKFIYGESIGQTFLYSLKVTDVGFVAKSLLKSKKMRKIYKENENYITLDSSFYTPIKQGVVLLNDTNAAKAFYRFLFSKKAKDILKEYGYKVD